MNYAPYRLNSYGGMGMVSATPNVAYMHKDL